MLNKIQRERYLRHLLLKEVGGQGQARLLGSKALVVGAGGLGAPIIQYLAAAGVGEIGVADDDSVELSNLQRQTIYTAADVGSHKTAAARRFVGALNPDVRVNAIETRITDENAEALAAAYDIVIEGVDSFEARFAINRGCIAARTPLVSAAIGRFDGQLSVFKPFSDPGRLPCYRCLVPEAPPRDGQINCAEEGVLGAIAGVMGTLAAMEALKDLLGVGETLAGRLLIYSGLDADMRTVRLPADPDCPDCRHLRSARDVAAE
ncbi:MAG: HesA/MoeB/ThiF family protein [Pseudomonadota bacterium]